MDTKNILFICGGAFDGLDKIIERRLDQKSIGFGANVKGKREQAESRIMHEVQPHDILKYGLIPELIGRLPVITALDALGRDELVRILQEPKNALVKQYQKLLSYDNVKLTFEPEALEAVADRAVERNIGARGLRAVMESILNNLMYEIPSDPTISEVHITKETVEGTETPVLTYDPNKPRYTLKVSPGNMDVNQAASRPAS